MELQKKDLGKVRGNLVRGGKGVNTPSSAKHLRSSASCFAFPTVLQSRLKLTLEKKRERSRRLKDLEKKLSEWGGKLVLFHFVC